VVHMQQSRRSLTGAEQLVVARQRDGLVGSCGHGHARQMVGLTVPCRDPRGPVRSRVASLESVDGDAVPVAEGAVLVLVRSHEERDRMERVARAFGLDHMGTLAGLDGVHSYVAAEPATCDVGAVVSAARSCGVDAGPDHIMALGGRAKWIPRHDCAGSDVERLGMRAGTAKWSDLSTSASAEPSAHAAPGRVGRQTVVSTVDQSMPNLPVIVVVDTRFSSWGRTDGVLDGVTGDRAGGDVIDLDPAHGTFVTGVARQVAPAARVHVVRAFGRDGVAVDSVVATKMLEAREIIAANGGRGVINLSWGCQTFDGRPPLATARALSLVCSDDIAVVAAAGNDGQLGPWFPAALPGVVSVGALALEVDELRGALWSNFGESLDVSTVGEGVLSTFVAGRIRAFGEPFARGERWDGPNPWAMWSGTSFAAPQVAGRVAQLLAAHPEEPASVIVKLLADDPTARDIDGFGLALRIL
jgi:hypothetical protein